MNPCYPKSNAKCVSPLQDYWFSLVFKRLVGPRVLAVRVAGLQRKPQPGRVIRDKLRIYAHCTSYDKYVLLRNHFKLGCNLYLNTPGVYTVIIYCILVVLFHLMLTDDKAHIPLALHYSCLSRFTDCCLVFTLPTHYVLLQTPEALCLVGGEQNPQPGRSASHK